MVYLILVGSCSINAKLDEVKTACQPAAVEAPEHKERH